jgi:hypothetical protein
MKMNVIKSFLTLVFATSIALDAGAQLTLTGTNYLQNFNTLSNGLPTGWSVRTNASATSLGTSANFPMTGKTWGDATGEFGNCASTVSNSGTNYIGSESTTIQGNCTNRAPGIRQTGSFGDSGAAFVLNLTNTLGCANFNLCLDFLMLNAQTRSNVWTLDYAVGNNPTNFTPLAAFADPGVFGATHTNISFGTLLDNQSSNVWIRLVALTNSSGSGSRDTIGMDNFALSWTGIISTNRPFLTGIILTNGSVQIDFTGDSNDTVSSFALQGAGQMGGTFSEVNATITQISPVIFRAACAPSGSQQFYRVKRP